MEIRIDRSKTYQQLEGFGASGAWWAQCVGGWDHIDPVSGMDEIIPEMEDDIPQREYDEIESDLSLEEMEEDEEEEDGDEEEEE